MTGWSLQVQQHKAMWSPCCWLKHSWCVQAKKQPWNLGGLQGIKPVPINVAVAVNIWDALSKINTISHFSRLVFHYKNGRHSSCGKKKDKTYLSLSSTPLSGNGPQRHEAGSEEEWELSFFTSPARIQKLELLFHTETCCECTETIQNIKKRRDNDFGRRCSIKAGI